MTSTHTEYEEHTATGQHWTYDEPGSQIEGEVIAYDPDNGATNYDGDVCGFIELATTDGEDVTVTVDKPNLKRSLRRAGPQAGDRVRIRFESWETSKKGREYKSFRVWIARKTEAF